jgi:hypothetical protein
MQSDRKKLGKDYIHNQMSTCFLLNLSKVLDTKSFGDFKNVFKGVDLNVRSSKYLEFSALKTRELSVILMTVRTKHNVFTLLT